MAIALAVLVSLLVIAVIGRGISLPATSDLVAASTVSQSSRPLVERFIDRSRRFRRNGALAGLVLATAAFTIHRNETALADASAELGLVPIAAIGFGGAVAGSVLAEAFRFGRRRGPRVASLDVRDPSAYDDPLVVRREQVLLVTTLLATVAALVNDAPLVRTLVLVCAIALLALIRRWGTRRIALRGRPAMPPELRDADDEVRRMAASSGLGRPVTILMALMGSMLWGSTVATADGTTPTGIAAAIAVVGATAAAVLWVGAAIWWFENRSFGLVHADGHPIARWGLGRLVLAALTILLVVPLVIVVLRSLVIGLGLR